MMNARGVLVSCSLPEEKAPRQYSGILLGGAWVITTGCILSGVVQENGSFNSDFPWEKTLESAPPGKLVRIPGEFVQEFQISSSVFFPASSVTGKLLSNGVTSIEQSRKPSESQDYKASSLETTHSNHQDIFKKYKCHLRYMWKSPHVIEAIDSLLSSWVLGSSSSGKEDSDKDAESEVAKQLLPLFIVLKLGVDSHAGSESEDLRDVLKLMADIFQQDEQVLRRGRMVIVESTPFGNSYFYNSVSEGVVSNVVGPGKCLFLTDARTALGCEGGPIFIATDRNRVCLVGMVLCSLSWWRGEWVGFTLGVSLKAAVHHCLLDARAPSRQLAIKAEETVEKLAVVDDCIVLVRCGQSWGSGIVIDAPKGIVLTCSHVVRKEQNNPVQIFWKELKKPAKTLFRSRDGMAYDAAILSVEPGLSFKSASLSSRIPVKGEAVIAAGFPLFSEDENSRPTVTRGVVSHVSNPAAMMQTTCCVQSGASGGAIFRSTGELVGLISCNTQDMSSGALYPHINMAVPLCMLANHLNEFITTGDSTYLKYLESADPVTQRIWKFQSLNSKL